MSVEDAGQTPRRRMGQILVERGFITADQLEEALGNQEQSGRLLGEICVEKWGVDRFALADALGEQWEEIEQGSPAAEEMVPSATARPRSETRGLLALLAEAQAVHLELASRTDDLERRLAALELIVTGVGDPLAERRFVDL